MSETKVCKFCQTEIPKKAKVCPNCKRTLKKGPGCLIGIIVFLIFVWAVIFGNMQMSKNPELYEEKK